MNETVLKPGPGVGGHCIAVDPWFIVAAAPEEAPLIRTARKVNDAKLMSRFRFENLEIWHRAADIARKLHETTFIKTGKQ